MQTIDHITFNARVYRRRSIWTVLLYQQNGVNVPVQLPNADVMSFIQVFGNLDHCRNHIERNLQKLVTLFAHEQNIRQWLAIHGIPQNLQEIKIFCNHDDEPFVNAWANRHKHKYRHTTFQIIDCDKLNYRLLLFGADHLKRLRSDFVAGSRSEKRARRNYKSICHVLANHFWFEANN